MPKNRPSRRLPVAEATAQVIIAQQKRVRGLFPGRPVGRLALLPATATVMGAVVLAWWLGAYALVVVLLHHRVTRVGAKDARLN